MGVIADSDDEVTAGELGDLRVAARPRPLAAASTIVRSAVAELAAQGHDVRVVARDALVTDEGEFAALATMTARRGGAAAIEVTLGMIFGDDSWTRVSAVAVRPGAFARQRAVARARVQGTRLGLPWARARKFRYPRPAGWRALERNGATEWYPSDFTHEFGVITVFPARPEAAAQPAWLIQELVASASFAADPETRREVRFRTPRGLEGTLVKMSGPGSRVLEVIELRDGQFIYPVRLESQPERLAAHRRLLEQVVDAIEPVPRPWAGPAGAEALQHWAA